MRRRVVALTVAALSLALVPDAWSCGERFTAHATPHGRGHRGALVIGDSTTIIAVPKLARRGLSADANGCRQWREGAAMVRARKHLPHLVVFALSTNGAVNAHQIRAVLRRLGPHRVLGLVTPRNHPSSARAMHRVAAARPNRVLLIDWRAYSAGRQWFAEDGLHVGDEGARAFANLIKRRSLGVIAPPHLPRLAHAKPRRDCGRGVVVLRGAAPCGAARAITRRPPLTIGIHSRWRWFDWRPTGWGPWTSIYRRGPWIVATSRP